MRISCFRRCGNLLTLDGSDDDLIRPQGCSASNLPLKIPELIDLTHERLEQLSDPTNIIQPEQWEFGLTADDVEINPPDIVETSNSEQDNNETLIAEDSAEDDSELLEEQEEEAQVEEDTTTQAASAAETIQAPDSDEAELITGRGRRTRRNWRNPVEGYIN